MQYIYTIFREKHKFSYFQSEAKVTELNLQ